MRVPEAGETPSPKVQPQPTEVESPQPSKDEDQGETWWLKTEDGEQYGPVPKPELDEWFEEGRITADCQVLRHGADQWQWASDVYPQLDGSADPEPKPPAPAPPEPAMPEPTQKSPTAPVVAPQPTASAGTTSGAFDFAAADLSASARARGRKRVRKVVKRQPAASAGASTHSTPPAKPGELSDKSKVVAGLLGIFLGAYGVHRFYLGYTSLGLIMLFTCGGCGIWSLIDSILVFAGSVPDAQGRPLR